jgi:hypothetical protein
MKPSRPRPKWKESGWSMSGTIQTVMYAIIVWRIYGLRENQIAK